MQKKAAVERTVAEILKRVAKLYQTYEEQATQYTDEKRKKMGAKIEKKQNEIMSHIINLDKLMGELEAELPKHKRLNEPELKKYTKLIRECWQDIQSIVKRKSLLFKVNRSLEELVGRTNEEVRLIKKQLATLHQTKMCGCIGIDGADSFKLVMDKFVTTASQWRLLAQLEPKDGVETFKSPDYQEEDYAFIKEIMLRQWPENTVTVKQVTKVVEKYNPGKPNKLAQANQYIFGINREPNPAYGLKIYHEEADNNDDGAACTFLGQTYLEGVLLPRNVDKAKKYFQKAISKQELYACFKYGMGLIKGEFEDTEVSRKTIEEGVALLKKAAFPENQNPIPEALVEMGELYERGAFLTDLKESFKIPVDIKKAIDCYSKARQMNVPRSSNNLGVLYISKKDFIQYELNPASKTKNQDTTSAYIEKGMKYLEEAEKMGFPQAFYNLGHIYENGVLGRKIPQEALIYYYKGGLKGDIQSRLKFAYQLMNQTNIMKEQYEDHYRISYRWLDNIVHKINIAGEVSKLGQSISTSSQKAEALFYMGLMFEYGFGVDKSPKKAFYYYSQSSDMGYSVAKNKIGDCYFSGFGVKEDRKLAIGCYIEAAEMKNSDSMVNLGTVHLNGIPGLVERNYNLAYKYFIEAIEHENSNAMIHLSYMYKNALGLQADQDMAKKLLEEAASNKNPTAMYMFKEMGGELDEKVVRHLDTSLFATPERINLNQIVPYLESIKI